MKKLLGYSDVSFARLHPVTPSTNFDTDFLLKL